MVVERKTSTKKYILAFVLTLIIFLGGVMVGILLENARLRSSQQIILEEKVNLRSLQLQQNYIGSGIADCNTLHQILENNINELGKKMDLVINYEKDAIFNQDEFNLQLQDYFLTEIQFYLISQEIDQKCGQDNVKILYFYDDNKEDTQGDILRYLKKKFENKILVFSLNSRFQQEPMIKTLLTAYNITAFPSIVMGNNVFQGHRNIKELMGNICEEFKGINIEVPNECKIVTSP